MVVQEKDLAEYMRAHGCPVFLTDELATKAHEITVHWRDLNGHWLSASYRPGERLFLVDEG